MEKERNDWLLLTSLQPIDRCYRNKERKRKEIVKEPEKYAWVVQSRNFSSLALALSFHFKHPRDTEREKTQSTQIIACFSGLPCFLLLPCLLFLLFNSEIESILLHISCSLSSLLFFFGKEENIKWNLLPDIERKKEDWNWPCCARPCQSREKWTRTFLTSVPTLCQ